MDNQRRSRLAQYRRERRKFALIVYLLTILMLVIGLIQWYCFWIWDDARVFFVKEYYVNIIFFALALILVTLFIFIERIRFIKCLNWAFALIIVECMILGVTAFTVRSNDHDILLFFGIVFIVVAIFIIIGTVLPHDLTLDVVILFVLAFIFLIVTVFCIMLYIVAGYPIAYIVYAVFISIIVLLFVMYHAQTINGGRFAEMRLNDYLLAMLILFHDFAIIYMLTFYAGESDTEAEDWSNGSYTGDPNEQDHTPYPYNFTTAAPGFKAGDMQTMLPYMKTFNDNDKDDMVTYLTTESGEYMTKKTANRIKNQKGGGSSGSTERHHAKDVDDLEDNAADSDADNDDDNEDDQNIPAGSVLKQKKADIRKKQRSSGTF